MFRIKAKERVSVKRIYGGKFIKGEDGFSLTEVIAAVAVSSILIILAALAIVSFFTKFKELSYFADLQQQAFEAIETMKYGYPVLDELNQYRFFGIGNAQTATLEALSGGWGAYSGIRCTHETSYDGHSFDYIRFFWDRYDKKIRVQGFYGGIYFSEQLFPKSGDDRIEVTYFNLTSNTGNPSTNIVKMELRAEIIISEEKRREVFYTTTISLGRH
ncbi:MAG: prepilin-type N-terminal cleavage/methylation domain-containing protein [Candidatus Cloacimonetes bacterium]|nr:prepilin-type N-terminal cleavage/methylation domain-containing protein [Candidatus Cloacimonadota bacterium]